MIEVFEITDKDEIKRSAAMFDINITDGDRAFVMDENGRIGMAVLRLERGGLDGVAVSIKDICVAEGLAWQYYDLLARSVLAALRDLRDIKVRVQDKPEYFKKFGFKECQNGLEILSGEIKLNCGNH